MVREKACAALCVLPIGLRSDRLLIYYHKWSFDSRGGGPFRSRLVVHLYVWLMVAE